MPKVLLLGNNVLIHPVAANASYGGAVHIPEKYRADPLQFRVLAVGPGRIVRKKGKDPVLIPIELKPGDMVLLPQIHGNRFAREDGTQIIEADEIIAKWSL